MESVESISIDVSKLDKNISGKGIQAAAVKSKNNPNFSSLQSVDSLTSVERPRLSPPGVYFTRREAECFFLLTKFSTVKKIARILGLSPRTVEMYIDQMKGKLGISFKWELIEKAIQVASQVS